MAKANIRQRDARVDVPVVEPELRFALKVRRGGSKSRLHVTHPEPYKYTPAPSSPQAVTIHPTYPGNR